MKSSHQLELVDHVKVVDWEEVQVCCRESNVFLPYCSDKLIPSVRLIFERHYDKPPPIDCLAKCALSPMCFPAERAALSFCTLSFSVSVSHTHEFTGGQAGCLAWTEMNTCWDQSSGVWFTFLFQSPAFFFLFSLTPHSHLSFLCLLPHVL